MIQCQPGGINTITKGNFWEGHIFLIINVSQQLIAGEEEIDQELMGWIKEAAALSDAKSQRRRK